MNAAGDGAVSEGYDLRPPDGSPWAPWARWAAASSSCSAGREPPCSPSRSRSSRWPSWRDYLARIVRDQSRPGHLPEDLELEEPAEPAWAVGTVGVSYDDAEDRVVLVIEELVPEDETGAIARLSISREQAAAFTIQATRLVESGRPPCPLCGSPLDPSGHECPRTNGHRPPAV